MTTVAQWLSSLPADRRAAIAKVRDVINEHLPPGYTESIYCDLIIWGVPESVLPAHEVHNKFPLQLAGLGSMKGHMAIYMMHVFGDPALRVWFEKAYKRTGKKLDMGKSCVRFKTVDALALDVIGEVMAKVTVEDYVARYRRNQRRLTPDTRRRARPQASRRSSRARGRSGSA